MLTDPRIEIQPSVVPQNATTDWSAKINPSVQSAPASIPLGSTGLNVEASPMSLGGPKDELLKEEAADMRHNRDLREKYAEKAYKLATGCISMWAILLGTQGAIKALTDVEMWSDQVIIAVTTGVTVSVLAAFLGVIRGLFGNGVLNGKDSKQKN